MIMQATQSHRTQDCSHSRSNCPTPTKSPPVSHVEIADGSDSVSFFYGWLPGDLDEVQRVRGQCGDGANDWVQVGVGDVAIDGNQVGAALTPDGIEHEGDGLSQLVFAVGFCFVEGFGDHLDVGRGRKREDHCSQTVAMPRCSAQGAVEVRHFDCRGRSEASRSPTGDQER